MIVEKAEKGVELEFIVGNMIPSEKKLMMAGQTSCFDKKRCIKVKFPLFY